jgi:hypothetical protein
LKIAGSRTNDLPAGLVDFMTSTISEDKDFSISDCDPISDIIGKICIVITTKNQFAAKLISIRCPEIWFENKRGLKWMVYRQNILEVKPIDKVV